ncbi:MAG TPA: wax ester/triacylglycerol synthase domain-containing protein [Burkholderiaceae bacterium]
MPKLSVIDLAMFLLETPERPFNIGPLVLLRPPNNAKRFADRLLKRMLAHEPGPPFNYGLKLSLSQAPSVEPIAGADVAAHVHRLTLPGKASMDDLIAKVCELHEVPLERTGLLWQFYVIDGLADGRVALYGKVHHGIIDGRSFVNAVTHWFSADPKDTEVRALWQGVPQKSHTRERIEAGLEGAPRAQGERLRELLKKSAGTLGSGVALYRMLAAQARRTLGLGGEAMDLPFVGVPHALSGAVSAKRSYAFTTLPLAELKALGKAHEATINDMLLAVLDGALDRYLAAQPQRPSKPLVVDMPVALAGASGGNQIAVLQLAMGKPGTTALQRLAAIRKETARVKAAVKANSSETVMLYTTLVHALPTLLERVGIKRPLRVSNLLFSNPFGFEGKSYLMGAEVELALPMSVVAAGQMLNVTVVTLGDALQIGFLGIPGAIDRIDELPRFTRDAFDALKVELDAPAQPSTRTVKPSTGKRAPSPRTTRSARKRAAA